MLYYTKTNHSIKSLRSCSILQIRLLQLTFLEKSIKISLTHTSLLVSFKNRFTNEYFVYTVQ